VKNKFLVVKRNGLDERHLGGSYDSLSHQKSLSIIARETAALRARVSSVSSSNMALKN